MWMVAIGMIMYRMQKMHIMRII